MCFFDLRPSKILNLKRKYKTQYSHIMIHMDNRKVTFKLTRGECG